MTDRTGLGVLEVAVLRAVDAASGAEGELVQSAEVLDVLEREGFAPAYTCAVLRDLAVSWRRHLPLLESDGNFGSPGNDPIADPRYTEVGLSPLGRLALRSEDGTAGPLPLGLIDGTAYCGGRVPPFAPQRVLQALSLLVARRDSADAELEELIGVPTVSTGAIVRGDVLALLHGERVTMDMVCDIAVLEVDGHQVLEVTGFPLGGNVDEIVNSVFERRREFEESRGTGGPLIADLEDHSSGREGVRLHVVLRHGVDASAVEQWLETVPSVSVEVDWQLPAPMPELLRSAAGAIRARPDGFHELVALLESDGT